MGKKTKRVLRVIGIAGLVITALIATGGLAAPAFLGATKAAAALTLGSISAGALAGGFSKTPSLESTKAGARGVAFADPNAHAVFAFGRTLLPLALVFEENHGDEDELISNVFAHTWHRIEGYLSTHIQGELVTFSGDDAIGTYAGALQRFQRLGTKPQSAITLSGTAWPATAAFEGVAHTAYVWNFKNQDALRGGIPIQIEREANCALLYDPRSDTTAGGSGAQRFDDPATWTFEPGNPVLVLLRFLIGEYANGQLVWGKGISEGDYDVDNFMSMANVADEVRDGIPRFQIAGVFDLDGDWQAFARRWEEETGGSISKSGGVYRCWLPHDDLTSLTTITEGDFLADAPVTHDVAGDIQRLWNSARGRYIEPAEGYRGFPYPEVTEPSAITDDGRKRVLTTDFSWIQSVARAERIVRYKIRRSRFQRVWTVPMGWEGWSPSYRRMTVHTLNCPETGGQDQLVRVIDRRKSFTGAVVLVLREEAEAIYDESLPLADPLASNTIPNRLDRLGTLSPRYIDGTALDALRPAEAGADVTAPRLGGNLVHNGGFEAGAEGWATNAEWAIVATPLISGTKAARFTSGATGVRGAPSFDFLVEPGQRYLALAVAQRDQASLPDADGGFSFRWQEADGTFISFSSITAIAANVAGLQDLRVIATAPANARRGRVVARKSSGASGAFFIDSIQAHAVVNDFDINALQTTNAPAEAGADQTSGHADDIIFRQASAPSSPQEGWIWIDSTDGNVYRRTSGVWVFIGAEDALNLANAPAEADANVTETRFSQSDWGETLTFTPTWGGFSSSPTGDMSYAISEDGRRALMWTDDDKLGASNASTMSISNLPAAIRPPGSGSADSRWPQAAGMGVARSSENVAIAARVWPASHASAGLVEFYNLVHSGSGGASATYSATAWGGATNKGLRAGTTFEWPLT